MNIVWSTFLVNGDHDRNSAVFSEQSTMEFLKVWPFTDKHLLGSEIKPLNHKNLNPEKKVVSSRFTSELAITSFFKCFIRRSLIFASRKSMLEPACKKFSTSWLTTVFSFRIAVSHCFTLGFSCGKVVLLAAPSYSHSIRRISTCDFQPGISRSRALRNKATQNIRKSAADGASPTRVYVD